MLLFGFVYRTPIVGLLSETVNSSCEAYNTKNIWPKSQVIVKKKKRIFISCVARMLTSPLPPWLFHCHGVWSHQHHIAFLSSCAWGSSRAARPPPAPWDQVCLCFTFLSKPTCDTDVLWDVHINKPNLWQGFIFDCGGFLGCMATCIQDVLAVCGKLWRNVWALRRTATGVCSYGAVSSDLHCLWSKRHQYRYQHLDFRVKQSE